MIGLLREQYDTLNINEINNRIWLNLDESGKSSNGSISENMIVLLDIDEGEEYIYEPYLGGLKDKIRIIYEGIKLIGGI